jgi:YhcH/YjgK/YiaL family protein
MIYDQAKNLDLYKNLGIGDRYAKAIEWLKTNDLASLPVATYEIDGRDVYAMVQEYTTAPWEDKKFETHDNYSDIQYVVKGKEILGYARRDDMTVTVPYDAAKDITRYADPAQVVKCDCVEDDFLIFFPTDGHKPQTASGEPSAVKKIVIKIKEV